MNGGEERDTPGSADVNSSETDMSGAVAIAS
jgi:hypothetical protein